MTEASVTVKLEERKPGERVAFVTIDNRAKLNCLPTRLIVGLRETFERLAEDDGLRAAVLTGAGERAFIGGADITELGSLDAASGRLFITRLHYACKAIRHCPVPVIGRINGFCLGAGLEVAASTDMRVVADGAVLGMPEVALGLPSVVEAALLPGLIGWGKTREILLTGETFDAQAALAMGFAQKVVPLAELDDAVEHWLALLLAAGPKAIRSQKALMNRWERVSVDEGVYAGIDALAEAFEASEPTKMIGDFLAEKASRKAKS